MEMHAGHSPESWASALTPGEQWEKVLPDPIP